MAVIMLGILKHNKNILLTICYLMMLGGWLVSCGAPEFGLGVYYPYPIDGLPAVQKPALQSLHFFVRSTTNAKQLAWSPVLQQSQVQLLPPVPCLDKAPALSWGILPGTWATLPPYVEILGFQDKDVKAQEGVLPVATVSGRFALETICQESAQQEGGRKATVFFAPPDSITPWKGVSISSIPNDWAQRIGHQVVRLPDGRYIIAGGVRSLKILPTDKQVYWQGNWHTHIAVYQPKTGELTLHDVGLQRAFFTAIWQKERLYLFGGMGPGAGANDRVILSNRVEVLSWSAEKQQWQLSAPTAQDQIETDQVPQRTFHHTLLLPTTQQQPQNTSFQYTLVGGITALPPQEPAADAGLQVIFHAATEVPAGTSGGRMVVVTGGSYRNTQGNFLASQAGHAYLVSDDAKITPVQKGGQIPAMLRFPRSGHVSVALAPELILVMGGFGGNVQEGGRDFVPSVEFLRRQPDQSWVSTTVCEPAQSALLRRIFATATVIHNTPTAVQILVAGGLGDRLESRPSLLVDWSPDTSKTPCQQLKFRVLNEPYQVPLFGMHTATVLDTGQVLLLGGAVISSKVATEFEVKSISALFNPGTSVPTLQNP